MTTKLKDFFDRADGPLNGTAAATGGTWTADPGFTLNAGICELPTGGVFYAVQNGVLDDTRRIESTFTFPTGLGGSGYFELMATGTPGGAPLEVFFGFGQASLALPNSSGSAVNHSISYTLTPGTHDIGFLMETDPDTSVTTASVTVDGTTIISVTPSNDQVNTVLAATNFQLLAASIPASSTWESIEAADSVFGDSATDPINTQIAWSPMAASIVLPATGGHAGTTAAGGLVIDAGPGLSGVHTSESAAGGSPTRNQVNDAALARPATRVVLVTMDGTRLAELENARIEGSVSDVLNDYGTVAFSLPVGDPKSALIRNLVTEVQIWRGNKLRQWGVITRSNLSENGVRYDVTSLDWYLSRRYVGTVPRPDAFNGNGRCEDVGLPGWEFGFDTGSIPASPPKRRRSRLDEPVYNGRKSLRLVGTAGFGYSESATTLDGLFAENSSTLTRRGKRRVARVMERLLDRRTGLGQTSVNIFAFAAPGETSPVALSQARAEAVEAYISAKILPPSSGIESIIATGRGTGDGTPEGDLAAENRRVTIAVDTQQEADGHGQYARITSSLITQPKAKKRPKLVSVVAAAHIEDFFGLPTKGKAMVVTVKDTVTGEEKTRTIQWDDDPPLNVWIQWELAVKVPPNGHPHRVTATFYPPNGVMYLDEVYCFPSDELVYVDHEQRRIVSGLLTHAQSVEAGKSDLLIGRLHVGKKKKPKRTRIYKGHERPEIRESIYEFATLADGMDVGMTYTSTKRWLTTWYPRRGREHVDGLVLSPGATIRDYRVLVDGETVATSVIVMRDGDGPDRREGTATDASSLDGLILEKVYEATPGSSVSSLQAQADRGLGRYSRNGVVAELTFIDGAGMDLDDIELGDIVPLSIHDDQIDHEGRVRIVGIDHDPNTNTVSLTTVPWDEWSV